MKLITRVNAHHYNLIKHEVIIPKNVISNLTADLINAEFKIFTITATMMCDLHA